MVLYPYPTPSYLAPINSTSSSSMSDQELVEELFGTQPVEYVVTPQAAPQNIVYYPQASSTFQPQGKNSTFQINFFMP
jgi:hypothetical protein